MPKAEQSVERNQNRSFEEAAAEYGPALERLARAYEAEADTRRDLIQEILIALWRSLEGFDGRCSLRTWVYRVAHNTAASHVTRQLRLKRQAFVALEEVPEPADQAEGEEAAGHRDEIALLYALIEQLKPLDRQVMVAYLEGMDAASTAEITGLSARNVATKIFRIKHILARRFQSRAAGAAGPGEGGRDER
ncbi:MAG: sigma-70 family RNA polymerase sigma factor [Terracidiphilus sp.]